MLAMSSETKLFLAMSNNDPRVWKCLVIFWCYSDVITNIKVLRMSEILWQICLK